MMLQCSNKKRQTENENRKNVFVCVCPVQKKTQRLEYITGENKKTTKRWFSLKHENNINSESTNGIWNRNRMKREKKMKPNENEL